MPTPPTRTYYNADITVRLRVMVASDTPEEARDAAKRAAALRPGLRADHIRDVYVSQLPPAAEMRAEDRRIWQEVEALRTGDSNQRARGASGCLPEAELLELARTELFRPFGLQTQRRKMVLASIPHPKADNGFWKCVQRTSLDEAPIVLDQLVEWSTIPEPALTAVEWRALESIRRASDEVARHPWMARRAQHAEEVGFQVREHLGVCKRCQEIASERTALVSIQWAGRVLSREYVL